MIYLISHYVCGCFTHMYVNAPFVVNAHGRQKMTMNSPESQAVVSLLTTDLFLQPLIFFGDGAGRVSLCSASWARTSYVDQAALNERCACLCLPNIGIKNMCHHTQLPNLIFLNVQISCKASL